MRAAHRGLPLFPCLCLGVAFLLLGITLLNGSLPDAGDEALAFAAGQPRQGSLRKQTQMHARKLTAADRGSKEYKDYFASKKQEKKDEWDLMTTPDAFRDATNQAPSLADFGIGMPDKAEEVKPPAAMQSLDSTPSKAAESGGGGGNPLQFIFDMFTTTTTTTTTTPPPNPIEAFFKSLR
eukprot:TRINITY_DN3559_c0_g2_i1.p1 TRINITY_DN3559_c0_g2~~TRINITY_DN3559_c0_g2_i1.p1  ORF type:complete len:180 (+),score=47.51 TRINITY_DN3559_c0_g2_i1:131-670(+)